MSKTMRLALGVAVSLAIVMPSPMAGRTAETFKGTLVCAFCTLKKADVQDCQDVLLVTNAEGATTEYYIAKNEVAKKAGEACTDKVPATITGTVSEKDGKKWLTATEIDKKR